MGSLDELGLTDQVGLVFFREDEVGSFGKCPEKSPGLDLRARPSDGRAMKNMN